MLPLMRIYLIKADLNPIAKHTHRLNSSRIFVIISRCRPSSMLNLSTCAIWHIWHIIGCPTTQLAYQVPARLGPTAAYQDRSVASVLGSTSKMCLIVAFVPLNIKSNAQLCIWQLRNVYAISRNGASRNIREWDAAAVHSTCCTHIYLCIQCNIYFHMCLFNYADETRNNDVMQCPRCNVYASRMKVDQKQIQST